MANPVLRVIPCAITRIFPKTANAETDPAFWFPLPLGWEFNFIRRANFWQLFAAPSFAKLNQLFVAVLSILRVGTTNGAVPWEWEREPRRNQALNSLVTGLSWLQRNCRSVDIVFFCVCAGSMFVEKESRFRWGSPLLHKFPIVPSDGGNWPVRKFG